MSRIFVLLLLLVLPVTSFAESSPLSLDAAIRLAIERAPTLDARRAQIEAARQEYRRAGALPDPMLIVGIDNLPVTGADAFDPSADFMTMKRIGVRQQVPAGAKREARRDFAAQQIDQARAQTLAERADIRQRTAQAWVDLLTAERDLDALKTLHEQAGLASELARARVSAGSELAANALGVESAVLALENRIDAAHARVDGARAELARWVGPPARRAVTETPDFAKLPVSERQLLSALDRLAPLLTAQAQVETAAAAIAIAKADKHADWSVAASYGQRGDGRSDMLMIEFGIELPLFAANRQDRGIAARRAEYQAALATREDARREQAAQIRADVAKWQALKQQVARDRTALLPLAADRSAAALAAYRAGAPIGTWLDARRDELDLVLEHTQRLGALGRAWTALAYLLDEEASQ